jgi:tRNA (guanine-N7-)-methyltransferase
MANRRIRHHVNPLNFRESPQIPNWVEVFEDVTRDLEVDIGCAKGHFMLARAVQAPDINMVGLEIRRPVVEKVQKLIDHRAIKNAHVICCNANLSLKELFGGDSIKRAYVHFPDPWFKKRHHKRRLIKPAFLVDLAAVLKIGGEFHFATDYQEYVDEFLGMMSINPDFDAARACGAPFGLLTDREHVHSSRGDAVHRYVFILKQRIATPDVLVVPEELEA